MSDCDVSAGGNFTDEDDVNHLNGKLEEKVLLLEADNKVLTAQVEEIQSLCMEFASLGRVNIKQNDALKVLCESYSEIANQRHLTSNRGKE